jgi:hypothetical protein
MNKPGRSIEPTIIIHAGAWQIPEELYAAHLNGIGQALETGRSARWLQQRWNTSNPLNRRRRPPVFRSPN